ncbi:DUF2064 domain-containing protein [Halorussus salilacus]|uniref:TIGR04282 family arsenosugar biosynthesis glycosyltransferase n=1 Tax=Halorussus salilacus TaxID=2953750 RepID=UPI00209F3DB1|nr:DUF2064 domain-containing protein [Halorussus salilacus]USZ68155.1 DUF2064 domain-containing protein [Halorussus salilacus]
MTVLAVFADPPRPGLALPELPESSPVSEREAADLYAAALKDTLAAVERSGGELLINYRPDDLIAPEHEGDRSAEAEVRALAADALDDPDDARFEVQVGSTFSARAGNTVTHLLEREGVRSAAVVPGTAPTLTRKEVDSAAMKLRRNEVVVGPSERGGAYFAGFTTAELDFEDAYAAPAVETLTTRAVDAGHEVEFLPSMAEVRTGADLLSLVPVLNARARAGRIVPEHTASLLREWGLRVVEGEDGPELVRE